jgi:hypothetical protein
MLAVEFAADKVARRFFNPVPIRTVSWQSIRWSTAWLCARFLSWSHVLFSTSLHHA